MPTTAAGSFITYASARPPSASPSSTARPANCSAAQFLRRRWKERLWLDPVLLEDDAVDTFYAFAQSCYHLVDWLENDQSQHVRRTEADAHVQASPALSFCREICHGSKHAQLEQKNVHVATTRSIDSVPIQDESGQTQEIRVRNTKLFVDWHGGPVDIEAFGRICVDEWDRFLRDKGLLSAEPMVAFTIDGVTYSLLRDDATSLSPEAQTAISNAMRIFGETVRELSCRPEIAHEIGEWLTHAERGYLAQPGQEWKASVCHIAAEAVAALLAGQAPPTSLDSN